MQLDAEEDDQAFYKPPVEPSARPVPVHEPDEGAASAQAAAVVTADDEE